jgi:hypothetical protein
LWTTGERISAAGAAHLPEDLMAVEEVASMTGWRIKSEIPTRQKSRVDLEAGGLRLNLGETKNREALMFSLTPELRLVGRRLAASKSTLWLASSTHPCGNVASPTCEHNACNEE